MNGLNLLLQLGLRNPRIVRRELLKACFLLSSSPSIGFSGGSGKSIDDFVVISKDGSIPEQVRSDLATQAKREFDEINGYLETGHRVGRIVVIVGKQFQKAEVDKSRYPAESVIKLPSYLVLSKSHPLAHELTHIIDDNLLLGSYLSEGLSVYMQDRVGRNKASPNGDNDIHKAFIKEGTSHGHPKLGMAELERIQNFGILNDEDQIPLYLQAGSFVKYLIEEVLHGDIKRFMKFYKDGNYQEHFKKSFQQIEAGWREYIISTHQSRLNQ